MSKPSDEEINRAIAEYMGLTVYPCDAEFMPACMSHIRVDYLRYTKSLDALVPVWIKLSNERNLQLTMFQNPVGYIEFEFHDNKDIEDGGNEYYGNGKSPSRALALACYEVIKNG